MRGELVGRERERSRLATFLDAITRGANALAITGEAGIGKSSLLKETLERAAERSYMVLSAAPAEQENSLPFAALGDLFRTLPTDVLSRLPAPQQYALEVALLRQAAPDVPAHQHAVSVAVLSTIRLLAESTPVIVSIDDLQWLDAPSRRVTQFVIRRLETERVGILVTAREQSSGSVSLGLDRVSLSDRFERIQLGPLGVDALDDLLSRHLGATFSKPTFQQLYRTSGGNPFFALEIGRFLLTHHLIQRFGDSLPVPSNLRELVQTRLAILPAITREALLVVSALSQPTDARVAAAMGADVAATALERAIDIRVIERSSGRLRFNHPLIGSVVYEEAGADRRRELHRRLAIIADDEDERVRHLALASDGPSATVADGLEAAAARANARGAPEAAAALMELASNLTPRDQTALRSNRTLKAADHHLLVGDTTRAEMLLEPLVSDGPSGLIRAQVMHRLGLVRWWTESLEAAEYGLQQALAESQCDDRFRSAVLRDLVYMMLQSGKLREAHAHARTLLEVAEESQNSELLGTALVLCSTSDCLLGNGVNRSDLDRATALLIGSDDDADLQTGYLDPLLYLGVVLKWIDDFDSSRTVLRYALERLSNRHEESGLAPCLFQLGELECWAGNWERASDYGRQAERAVRHSGQSKFMELPKLVEAQVLALRGEVDGARAAARDAYAIAAQQGDTRFSMRAQAVLGFVDLSLGDAAGCVSQLGHVRTMAELLEYGEPGVIRFEADEIEALIALGKVGEAEPLTKGLEDHGTRLDRPWALAAGGRCRALLHAALGELDDALASARGAIEVHSRLAQPMELARTLLVMGSIQRRLKDRRSARVTLERAAQIFDELGSSLWSAKARTELGRIGGRPHATQQLSATEWKVAELIAGGATNREIASQLFMSVKTVEANLSRIYQKLGLRSRTALATWMVTSGSKP